ncbi:FkbM family methyltransferase [Helicobacter suis]|uniref:FkbM family methyltransferase n=1 Tax=Helicobacter suis TaxID=104628 RepID=UPI003D31B036
MKLSVATPRKWKCQTHRSQHNNTTTQQHNNTTTQQHNNTTTQQHTLDSLLAECGFVPNFIKIDTDGFDFKILRGAYKTLKDNKPVLFFEWDYVHLANQSEVALSIFAFLSNLGSSWLFLIIWPFALCTFYSGHFQSFNSHGLHQI